MTVAEMKAGAEKAIELINSAVAAIGDGDTLLGESAVLARAAIDGSGRHDRDEAPGQLLRAKTDAGNAARYAESASAAVMRWHDAI